MRIATSTLFSTAVGNMNQQQATVVDLQQQISTNRRVNTPADDPVAAASAVQVNLQIARNADLTTNRQAAESSLSTVGTTFSSMTALLTSVKSELVSAGNGTYAPSERKVIAQQLQGQMQDLMGYANTQDSNGTYLFGGFQSKTLKACTTETMSVLPSMKWGGRRNTSSTRAMVSE